MHFDVRRYVGAGTTSSSGSIEKRNECFLVAILLRLEVRVHKLDLTSTRQQALDAGGHFLSRASHQSGSDRHPRGGRVAHYLVKRYNGAVLAATLRHQDRSKRRPRVLIESARQPGLLLLPAVVRTLDVEAAQV